MITRRAILSDPDPLSRETWLDYDLDIAAMTVTIRAVKGLAVRGLCSREKEAALVGTWLLGFDPLHLTDQHILFITLTGDLVFLPRLTLAGQEFFAHLAWVNPVTGKADTLQFIDGRLFVEEAAEEEVAGP